MIPVSLASCPAVLEGRSLGSARAAAPGDAVGDHALDLGLVVDGILLVARAEVDDPTQAAPVARSRCERPRRPRTS